MADMVIDLWLICLLICGWIWLLIWLGCLAVLRSPEQSAWLVFEEDGHVAPRVQIAPGDVDNGPPGNGPPAGLQVNEPGHLKGSRGQRLRHQKGHGMSVNQCDHG